MARVFAGQPAEKDAEAAAHGGPHLDARPLAAHGQAAGQGKERTREFGHDDAQPRKGKLPGQRQFHLRDAAAADERLAAHKLPDDEGQHDERPEDGERGGKTAGAVPQRLHDAGVAVVVQEAEDADNPARAAAHKGRLHDETQRALVAQGLHFAQDRHMTGQSRYLDFGFSFHGRAGWVGAAGRKRRAGRRPCGTPCKGISGRKRGKKKPFKKTSFPECREGCPACAGRERGRRGP